MPVSNRDSCPWISILREAWTHVDVTATRGENAINLEIVYVRPDGSSESDVDIIRLDEYFFGLAELVSTPEKGLYKTCTFHLESDGWFKVDFTC